MARKKQESMLTRQRRLLKEQRAKKAAAKAAKANASKSLPSRGQTGGNSLKSRSQRRGTAKRVAGQQQRVISEAMRKTMKQRQALDKKEAAAKGTKGTKVQTGTRTKGGPLKRQGSSAVKPSRKGAAASTRVQKVKVRVEPQKSLKAGSQKALKAGSQKALPSKSSAKTQPGKAGSARRVNAAVKKARAAQGTTSKGVRTGQPAGAANRMYGAKRVSQAVSRATRGKKLPFGIGGAATAVGLAAEGIAMTDTKLGRRVKGNLAQQDKDRKSVQDMAFSKARQVLGKKKTSGAKTNSRGRRVGTVPASKSKSSAKTTKSNNASAINARLKKQRAEREKAKSRSGGNANSQILRPAPKASKPAPTRSSKPTPTRTPAPTKQVPTKQAAKKPTYKTPTKKGPDKAGNYYKSQGSSTKGGPTADGKTYKNQIKSKRLRDALNNLKVRKYKK